MMNHCKKKRIGTLSVLVALCLALSACSEGERDNADSPVPSQSIEKEEKQDINSAADTDSKTVYAFDDDTSVVTMYLTVRRGNSGENTDHSWDEVNGYSVFDYARLNVDRYQTEAILQVGDENGPQAGQLGYGVTIPNATVQIRGNTTSTAAQKSFKIKLKKDKGDWNGQRTIALNKHPYDPVRFRNKLSYDLIKTIPGMIGARTQFVHLYVKDETNGNASAVFQDYGLFTQVEQLNTRYLRNHGLDESGQLYKAEMFEFTRYDQLRLKTDPKYDVGSFGDVLEIKGNDDHSKLLTMLEDLNNDSLPIEEVFSKYFDEENYFTWLAFSILTGNTDTINRNFYLYSPQNAQKFYFISWDNDAAWRRSADIAEGAEKDYGHMEGISNYWGIVLHERILRNPDFRKKLDDKVEELHNILSAERLTEMVKNYQTIVEPYLFSMPDAMHTDVDQAMFQKIVAAIPQEIELNYQLYRDSLDKPMPFYSAEPVYQDGGILYQWDTAFDFDGEDITYTFEVSNDLSFQTVLMKRDGLKTPYTLGEKLPVGQYFYRITAQNASGYEQKSLEYYTDTDGEKHFGTRCFYVLPDGSLGGAE